MPPKTVTTEERMEALVPEKEAARILCVSVSTLRSRRRLGQDPEFVRIGGRVLYRPATLRAFIDASAVRIPVETTAAVPSGVYA